MEHLMRIIVALTILPAARHRRHANSSLAIRSEKFCICV